MGSSLSSGRAVSETATLEQGVKQQRRCEREDQGPLGNTKRLKVQGATLRLPSSKGNGIPKGTSWDVYGWDAWCLPQVV